MSRREAIYEDDGDRRLFLGLAGDDVDSFDWMCHAYCLKIGSSARPARHAKTPCYKTRPDSVAHYDDS